MKLALVLFLSMKLLDITGGAWSSTHLSHTPDDHETIGRDKARSEQKHGSSVFTGRDVLFTNAHPHTGGPAISSSSLESWNYSKFPLKGTWSMEIPLAVLPNNTSLPSKSKRSGEPEIQKPTDRKKQNNLRTMARELLAKYRQGVSNLMDNLTGGGHGMAIPA